MFFKDVEYDAEVFNDPQKPDLTSAFGKQWRTTVNKVDLDNPVRMSNGIAYYVTSLKLPQKDVLIWRFKDCSNGLTHGSKRQRQIFCMYKFSSVW